MIKSATMFNVNHCFFKSIIIKHLLIKITFKLFNYVFLLQAFIVCLTKNNLLKMFLKHGFVSFSVEKLSFLILDNFLRLYFICLATQI